MNKILSDYIACVRKRMITDKVGSVDAAACIAEATWKVLTETRTREVIRDSAALREALTQNGFTLPVTDSALRRYLRERSIS